MLCFPYVLKQSLPKNGPFASGPAGKPNEPKWRRNGPQWTRKGVRRGGFSVREFSFGPYQKKVSHIHIYYYISSHTPDRWPVCLWSMGGAVRWSVVDIYVNHRPSRTDKPTIPIQQYFTFASDTFAMHCLCDTFASTCILFKYYRNT